MHEVDEKATEYAMYQASTNSAPIQVILEINHVDVPMEIDTGATLSIISEHSYNILWQGASKPTLRATNARLKM